MKTFRVWMKDCNFSLVKAESEEEARRIAVERVLADIQELGMLGRDHETATTVWRVKCVDPIG